MAEADAEPNAKAVLTVLRTPPETEVMIAAVTEPNVKAAVYEAVLVAKDVVHESEPRAAETKSAADEASPTVAAVEALPTLASPDSPNALDYSNFPQFAAVAPHRKTASLAEQTLAAAAEQIAFPHSLPA